MKIDKQNGDVAFSENSHTYWNVNDNERYISVTTLIDKYVNEFDKDFWSAYKALERLIPADNWKIEKKSLLNTHKFDKEILSLYNISELDFNKTQQDILDEWDYENKISCARGTKIHAQLENAMYKAGADVSLKKFGLGGKFVCDKGRTNLDLENGVYPEYLISRVSPDGVLKLAGQIDLLIKKGNNIWIIDYKTNKKIDQHSFFDSKIKKTIKMKYPLGNIEDCNFYHYTLQLSTYAWMIEKLNPEFKIQDLIIVHYDHDNKETIYHLEYLKDEVEKMLKHYKKSLLHNRQLSKYKKIEY